MSFNLSNKKIDSEDFNLFFDDESIGNTKELAKYYAELAAKEGCDFLNAAEVADFRLDDGIHFDKKGHSDLANAIVAKIQSLFSNEFQSK